MTSKIKSIQDKSKWFRNGFGQILEYPRNGKYSDDETQAVRMAIQSYCEANRIDPSRLCDESDHRMDNLRGAWMQIAQSVPHRTVQSVYRHGTRLFHPFKRGEWTLSESDALITLVERYGQKWAHIQKKLNRSADSCRDKYREIASPSYTKGKWTKEESRLLLQYVRDALKVGDDVPVEDLVPLVFPNQNVESSIIPQNSSQISSISWDDISAKMKLRSRLSCFKRFRSLCGLTYDPMASIAVDNAEQPSSNNITTDTHKKQTVSQTGLDQHSKESCHHEKVVSTASEFSTTTNSYDDELLNIIATSNYEKESDIPWKTIRSPMIGDAKVHWCNLVDKWADIHNVDIDSILQEKSVSELARIIQENCCNDDSSCGESDEDTQQAEIAARTVEAVLDL